MLNIEAHWSKPLVLSSGLADGLLYTVEDDSIIPETPGAYVFVRIHGKKTAPLYIGETAKLRTRFWQHLTNKDLMERIRKCKSGQRAFMFCKVRFKRKQDKDKVQGVLQRALIEHALSVGHLLAV